jgi:hypothetical protein
LNKYPDSDVAQSARWMLGNIDKPHPKFESIEDMKKRMNEGQGE